MNRIVASGITNIKAVKEVGWFGLSIQTLVIRVRFTSANFDPGDMCQGTAWHTVHACGLDLVVILVQYE